MIIPLYVVDEIEAIVGLVNTKLVQTIKANETAALGSSKIELISFHKGTYEELLETLHQKDASTTLRNTKYPLVYLQEPFTEHVSNNFTTTRLRILIIHQTIQNYKITDRYSKVFKPVLVPIYWELLNQIRSYSQIVQLETPEHEKTILPLGREHITEKNEVLLNDFVDAIDISDLNISFYPKISSC